MELHKIWWQKLICGVGGGALISVVNQRNHLTLEETEICKTITSPAALQI